jgi:hypothetical protein
MRVVVSFDSAQGQVLEGEIEAAAHHTKIVVRPIYYIPAEIIDPADMRSDADFDPAAELANCPRLRISLFGPNDSVAHHNVRLFATAKDATAAGEDVRCKTRARDWLTQRERAQHGTHRAALVPGIEGKNLPVKIDKDILKRVPGIHHPAFDADTEVTVEKVFEVNATAPGVIRLQVAIILPLVSCEHVSAPQTDVKLVVRVPLRARRRYHLLHLLTGIDFRASKSR